MSEELTEPGEADLPTRTSVHAASRLPAGARLGGRYRIAGLLGFGGMGMVYRAEDEQLGLSVALKILRPDMAPAPGDHVRWLARFKQELVLARQVSHPNVVRIHDIGTDGDLVFLTMDLVPGRSLYQLLAEEGPLPPARATEIARQIALGLGAAHRAGVVHRDLKPANVLVDDTGGSLRAAITDFGIARSLSGTPMTRPGTVLGTLGYLSPEQARGETVDGRSDLYPLGLLLYEMLTGKLPFSEATEAEMLAQRLTGGPRRLRWSGVFGAAAPPRLRGIIHRLLAPDPARRYPTAEALIEELDRLGAGTSTGWARSPLARRTALGLGIVGLAVLLAWGLTAWRRARPARPAGIAGGAGAAGTAPPLLPAAAAGGRHAVALLPLADETGRPDLAWVATGIPEMLTAALAESPELQVLDSHRVFLTLEDLKLPRGPLPDAEAARLASLLDADRLVGGRVHAAGGRLRIDLSLVVTDPPGLPAAEIHAEAPESEAFRLVDEIGATLRRRLAIPAIPPSAAGGAEPVASRSPAALRSFAQGSSSLSRGDALVAVPALEAAVAADPRFTAAWIDLARALATLGRSGPARQAAARAVATLRPGESRAAYEARAVEARLLGRLDHAQEILTQLLARYPDDVEARIELAEAYGEQGSLDRAIAALAAVVRRAPHHPRAWYLLGKYSIVSGDARRAVDEYLVRALVVQNGLGSDEGRAEVFNAFGVGYRNLGEMERATENYEQAAALRKKIGDERGYATTLRNLANIHLVRNEYKAAAAQLAEGLALLQRLGDRSGMAEFENDFGALAEQRGSYEEALAHYQQALRDRRDLGNDLDLAQSFANVGFTCYVLGRYDDALVYLRQGLDLAKKNADPSGIVLATQNLGQLELARGQWDEAVKSFLTALQQSRQLGMKEAMAVSLGYLGRLAQYQGRPAAALASYGEALKLLRELGDQRGLSEFLLAEGEVLLALGRTEAAAGHLQEAEEVLRQGTNREHQAELLRLRGEELLARGRRAEAATVLRRAVSEATASHGVVERLASRLSLAAAGTGGDAGLAGLERLSTEADALGNAELRLRAAELLARTALAAGDPRRAEKAARAGLDQAAACGGSAGAYRLHLLLARALERGGSGGTAAATASREAEAKVERRRAGEEIARVGRELGPEERKSFERKVEIEEGEAPGREIGALGGAAETRPWELGRHG